MVQPSPRHRPSSELDRMIAHAVREGYAIGDDRTRLTQGLRRMTAREYRSYRRLLGRLNRDLPPHLRSPRPGRGPRR